MSGRSETGSGFIGFIAFIGFVGLSEERDEREKEGFSQPYALRLAPFLNLSLNLFFILQSSA